MGVATVRKRKAARKGERETRKKSKKQIARQGGSVTARELRQSIRLLSMKELELGFVE